jgi:adenylate cyclase
VLNIIQNVVLYVYLLVIYIVFYALKIDQGREYNQIFENTMFIGLAGFYGIVNHYIYRATEIEGFNSDSQSLKKVEEMNDFINRLLPKHVVKSLGQESENVGERHHNVTLLYADIVGFTEYSAGN